MNAQFNKSDYEDLSKAPTGITGLDDITNGGLPRGRPTLVFGSPGSGKTLLGLEFLARGAQEFDEPGVFIAFEETEKELNQNTESLGFGLEGLVQDKKLLIDHIHVERGEIEETGEYDLEGLFLRLKHAIESVGAKRIVLDTIEVLFSGFSNKSILRSELRRLSRWLKDNGLTAIITGERGKENLTRHGLEEYVSDCVIMLKQSARDMVYTRHLRIIKYRGSVHETNEFPFLIDDDGISILPITSLGLDHPVSDERVSTGIQNLDEMLGGQGFYKGSSVLVSGTAGTGKTSLCAHIADAACSRGEKVLYLSFEESSQQIIRDINSIGIDLKQWVDKDLLKFHSERVSIYGLEAHLTIIHKIIKSFSPAMIIIDPLNSYVSGNNIMEAKSMLIRLTDFIKSKNITGFFTNLTNPAIPEETTNMDISSIMDVWISLRDIEQDGERNRGVYVLKSRGIANSNQIREFLITSQGVKLKDVYIGPEGVMTGSARVIQEQVDEERHDKLDQEIERLEMELDRKQKALKSRMELDEIQLETDKMETYRKIEELKRQRKHMNRTRQKISKSRKSSK
ncbi:MAG TPA: circadian clock protein KaiC [bacterium]|nr:circadian clock protein KaiC [bacterium]